MDDITISITGLDELETRLEQLPEEIASKTLRAALRASGAVVQQEVQSRAPVKTEDTGPNSNSLPPGALRASIRTRVSLKPTAGSVTIGPSGKTSYVARWIEFGHALVGHKPGLKHFGNVPARPFLRPAFDASAQKAIETFKQKLKEGLDKLGA